MNGYEYSVYLINGFSRGFRLGYVGDRVSFLTGNLKSCLELPDFVEEKIQKELKFRRIDGPFIRTPFDIFCVSPIGLVPKKEPNSYRVIQHLSYPEGTTSNDKIDPNLATV